MDLIEKTTESKNIYDGKVIKVTNDKVLLPNGNTSFREVVHHCGGSAILCVNNNKVLLERQFRYALNDVIWEIPAGKLNEKEDPLDTAFRELEEECGLKAEKMTLISRVFPSPGYTNEIINIYMAEGLSEGSIHFDDDEFIQSAWIELDKAKEMILNGEIRDAKTLIALLYFFNEGHNK